MKKYLLLLSAFALSSSSLLAGYVIRSTQIDLNTGEQYESEIQVEGLNLRTKVDMGESDSEMIFLGNEKKILNIMHSQRRIMEMNAESMQAMGTQMDAAMQQMQEQLSQMPPEQRAMMEKMMAGSMPKQQAAPPKPEYTVEPTGETEEVNGIKCRKYEMRKDGEKTTEIFAAPWRAVDAGPDSTKAMNALGQFMRDMLSKMKGPFARNMQSQDFADFSRIDGFPLLVRNFENGVPVSESRMDVPEKRALPADTFEVPVGYEFFDPAAEMQGAF